MPPKKTPAPAKVTVAVSGRPIQEEVQKALTWLENSSSVHDRENLERFAISASKAFGVSMLNTQALAKELGRNHELAIALWETGWYEARLLASLIDEPAKVAPAQMERWCRDFDNWGICDTVCFHLFDRTPHAWGKVQKWCERSEEFEKRAAFALLWGLTRHDKSSTDERFIEGLCLIEQAATDERNFVKKAVNMALRAVGKRNSALHGPAVTVATRLAESSNPTTRWIGKDALRELVSDSVRRRLKP